MSPLRAVVSRGHIAFLNLKAFAHSRRVRLGLREAAVLFYGSLRAVKVVHTTASTLTVLARQRLGFYGFMLNQLHAEQHVDCLIATPATNRTQIAEIT